MLQPRHGENDGKGCLDPDQQAKRHGGPDPGRRLGGGIGAEPGAWPRKTSKRRPNRASTTGLGGVFAIAAVVDYFSDAVVKNPIVGQQSQNPQLRDGTPTTSAGFPASSSCARCGCATFPAVRSSSSPPAPARRRWASRRPTANLKVSPAEFDEVAAELGRTLDHFQVPDREKSEVLAAFAAHKDEVTAGYAGT